MHVQADEVLRVLLAECGAEPLHATLLAQGYDLFTAARITTEVCQPLALLLLLLPGAVSDARTTHSHLLCLCICLCHCLSTLEMVMT